MAWALVLAAAGWGCSSSAAGTDPNDGGVDGIPGVGVGVEGAFAVELIAADPTTGTPAFSTVLGSVRDSLQPAALGWTVLGSMSGCTLRKPKIPFCDPACGGDVCAVGDVCKPHPKPVDVGAVRALGLGAGEIVMQPINGSYQLPADVELPNPPCAEGAEVSLEVVDPAHMFKVKGKGIAPLVLSGGDPLALDPKQPLALAWAPPGDATIARIRARIDISHHGGFRGEIVCDVPDTGALEIPATFIEQLIGLGVSGFPTIVVTRNSQGIATGAGGRMTLTFSSSVERNLAIPGLVSCDDSHPCPMGQTCQTDRRCQ
jgi:hypothetical protein